MNYEEAQKKAKELGHCLCHTKLKCPCPAWIKKHICRCAQEGKTDDNKSNSEIS